MWCGTSINFVKHNLVAEGLCVPGDGIARCTGPALLWVLLQGWDFTWSQPYFIIYFIYDCISSGFMIPPTLHQLLWRYFPVSAVRPILFIITKHSRNVPLIHLPFGKDIILQQYKLLMRTIWGRKLWLNMINIQLCQLLMWTLWDRQIIIEYDHELWLNLHTILYLIIVQFLMAIAVIFYMYVIR